ncbi:MAG: T9SS type A sorting domain-containing protein [Bacteroidota bacterium]
MIIVKGYFFLILFVILSFSIPVVGQVGETEYTGSSYLYAYGDNGVVNLEWECSPKPGISSALLGCKLFRQNYFDEPQIELTPQILFETDGTYRFEDTLAISDTVPYLYYLRAYYSDTILDVTSCMAVRFFKISPYNNNQLSVKIKPRATGLFYEEDNCDGAPYYVIPVYDSIEYLINYVPEFDYCGSIALRQVILLDSSGFYYWGSITLSDEYLYALLQTLKTDEPAVMQRASIFPNPGNDYIILENTEPGSLLQLFDLKGESVLNELIEAGRKVVITSEMLSGFYIYKIQNKNGYTQQGKWLKQ